MKAYTVFSMHWNGDKGDPLTSATKGQDWVKVYKLGEFPQAVKVGLARELGQALIEAANFLETETTNAGAGT